MADRIGQQFGHYQLTRKLGSGGFADVYLGTHIYLGNEVAIKVIRNELSDADKELFRTEGRNLVRLIHPNIVRLLDFGIENDIPYLVMDYAPNGSLHVKYSKGTRLPLVTIVPYVKQAAEALQYAHDRKLIHRDVKPENMLMGYNNEVVLSDFGIAVVAHSTKSMRTEEAIGTVSYMAPEQLQKKPRPASDQYALAIVVYSWLTGTLPFTGTFVEVAMQHLTEPVPPLRTFMPTLPVEVERVVVKALQKDPEQRYETIRDFALALEQASQQWVAPTVRVNLPNQHPLQPAQPVALPQPYKNEPAETLVVPYPKYAQPHKTKEQCFDEGDSLFDVKRFREAIVAYSNVINLDPQDAEAYNNRGNAYAELLEYQRAIEDYNQAIAFDSQSADAYYNRGNAFFDLQHYRKAIEDYNRALTIDPNYSEAEDNRERARRLLYRGRRSF